LTQSALDIALDRASGALAGARRLSSAQQRLWFLEQISPESAVHNTNVAVRVSGHLNVKMLFQAAERVIARHDVLQIRIDGASDGAAPVRTHDAGRQPLTRDVSHAPYPELAAAKAATDVARMAFVPRSGEMVRFEVVRVGAKDHIIVLAAHRIVADRASLCELLAQIADCYCSLQNDTEPAARELLLQFSEYVRWETEQATPAASQIDDAYWRDRLDGAAPLDLPTDHVRSPERFRPAQSVAFALDAVQRREIWKLAEQNETDIDNVLMTGLVALMARYTAQQDIVVGTLLRNCPPQFKRTVGYFQHLIVLRTDCSDDPSVRHLMRQVSEARSQAQRHLRASMGRLGKSENDHGDPRGAGLPRLIFVSEPGASAGFAVPGVTARDYVMDGGTTEFDLVLSVIHEHDRITCTFEYDAELFDRATVEQLARHLERVLTGLARNLSTPLSRLSLLDDEDLERLLVTWNSTAASFSDLACVHELFEAQVDRTPDAMALRTKAGDFTYADLEHRANRLAHLLRERGARPNRLVGVLMERNVNLWVGILGALKAGAGYVPLDPTYPKDRLNFIVEDSQVELIVTEYHLISSIAGKRDGVVCLDTDADLLYSQQAQRPERHAELSDLAYVIYTSGSTGRPKGVMIEHRAASNLLCWARRFFSADELRTMLCSTSYCFDLSVPELFLPITTGGSIVLVDDSLHISDAVATPSMLNMVPSVLNELIATDSVPDTVVTVSVCGEPLSRRLVDEIYRRTHVQRVLNFYGPTETTVFSTVFPVGREDRQTPAIGRPLANTELFVLDRWQHPVPVGVVGELYISGAGVARGYLNNPELTAERFFPNPFRPDSNARMYRTGDLVRYRPDGNLEYVSRTDHQVKIRGFRVELGEVEAVLCQHARVSQAVASIREAGSGGKRLVAYVVARDGKEADLAELRDFMSLKVPSYMVPSLIVQLESMPLNLNGKIDRGKLPAPPTTAAAVLDDVLVQPRDETEQVLAGIWQAILKPDREFGVYESFFDLGGDSLLVVRLFAEIERILGVRLPVSAIFEDATVAGLVAALRRESRQTDESLVVRLNADGTRLPLFCVHVWNYELLTLRNLALYLGPDQPLYGLEPIGLHGRRDPHRRIEDMASHAVGLMRSIQPTGPYFLCGHSLGGWVAYEMAMQLDDAGERVAFLGLFDAYDPVRDRLIRRLGRFLSASPRAQITRLLLRSARLPWLRNASYGWLKRISRERVLAHDLPVPELAIANLVARREFRPRPYPGHLTFFQAKQEMPGNDPTRGWARLARDGVEVYDVPGDHFDMMSEPNVEALAQSLRSALDRVSATRGETPVPP
jgi:amino acid adenylation domain-containing protein